MAKTADLTPSDFIKKTIGKLLFTYYAYIKYFTLRPRDMEDLVDGLLFIEARNFLEKQSRNEDTQAEMAGRN